MNTERHKELTRELVKLGELHHAAIDHLAQRLMALEDKMADIAPDLTPARVEDPGGGSQT